MLEIGPKRLWISWLVGCELTYIAYTVAVASPRVVAFDSICTLVVLFVSDDNLIYLLPR
jgi:hypothetical protein